MLSGVAKHRNHILEGLRQFETVFASLPNSDAVVQVAADGSDEAKNQAQAAAVAQLESKLWVPYLRIENTVYPEPAPGTRVSKNDETKRQPAIKFNAFAMIKSQQDSVFDEQQITKLVKAPLEQALGRAEVGGEPLTHAPTVEIKPGNTEPQCGVLRRGCHRGHAEASRGARAARCSVLR